MPNNEQRVIFVIFHDKEGKLGVRPEFSPKLVPEAKLNEKPMPFRLRQAIAAQIAIAVTEQIKAEQQLVAPEAEYKLAVYELGSFTARTAAFNALKEEGCVNFEDLPHPTDATKMILKGYFGEVKKSQVAVEAVDKPV